MKRLLILTALLPVVGFAQPINTLTNPDADSANPAKRDAESATENANSVATAAFRKPDKQ